jgi:N-acetyl-gamma-glutamyl-phosphate reductase
MRWWRTTHPVRRRVAGSACCPPPADGKLDATALNDTNKLELRVFANEAHRHAVLIARLDNLGKGASGAAVQNLQLMLGL